MPELPEVETVRRTLKNFIIGKEITDIMVHYDKIVNGDATVFIESLKNQTIRNIDRVGKYLIFILDRDAFISHLRMEGKYNIVGASQPLSKHEHLSFCFADGTQMRYHDTRKFGRVELANRETYRQNLPLCKLGPEPWQVASSEFYQRIGKSSLPIKTLLLNQSIIAGIGNIYANEICFQVRLHPKTPGNRITKKDAIKIIKAAQEILTNAIEQGGTTIHSFDANGISGLFQAELKVHMKGKCPVCQGLITKEMVCGRGTYYCRKCQKKKSKKS